MLNSFVVVSSELPSNVDQRKNRAQVGWLLKCPWIERLKKGIEGKRKREFYKCFSDCTYTTSLCRTPWILFVKLHVGGPSITRKPHWRNFINRHESAQIKIFFYFFLPTLFEMYCWHREYVSPCVNITS